MNLIKIILKSSAFIVLVVGIVVSCVLIGTKTIDLTEFFILLIITGGITMGVAFCVFFIKRLKQIEEKDRYQPLVEGEV